MRPRVPFGALTALAAVLGIAAIPAVTYSASMGHHQGPKAKANPCGQAKVKKLHMKCAKTATLIVHVYINGGPASCGSKGCPEERWPVWVGKLGAAGEVLSSFRPTGHTIHVVPGQYEVATMDGGVPNNKGREAGEHTVGTGHRVEGLENVVVTVGADHTVEVTLHFGGV